MSGQALRPLRVGEVLDAGIKVDLHNVRVLMGLTAIVVVISFDGSGTIGYGRAFIRWIAGYLSYVVFFLGFLWMLWDKEKQCWHDKLASDVVVPVCAYPIKV
ncbi:MAG TPA: RDD family protein [Solirubrobacteraceae bacterium]|nr:RDD family protein [Solirubrobacteraceae bacterium]